MGPYAYKDNQWVGYDDVDIIRRKSEYIRDNGFGGGMIWALDFDDFNNICGDGEYPLLTAINQVFLGGNLIFPCLRDFYFCKLYCVSFLFARF